LEYVPDAGRFSRGLANPLDLDLLVIQDAHFLDDALFRLALEALPLSSSLVLMGDLGIRPFFGPGAPFRRLFGLKDAASCRLSDMYSRGKSILAGCLRKLGAGEAPKTAMTDPGLDFYFVPERDESGMLRKLKSLFNLRIPRKLGMDKTLASLAITAEEDGPLGAWALNGILLEESRKEGLAHPKGYGEEPLTICGRSFCEGQRVMAVRDDPKRGLSRGDFGFVKKASPPALSLEADFEGKAISCSLDGLWLLEPSFALSASAAGAAEAPAVVICLGKDAGNRIDRSLLYASACRARELLVILGNPTSYAKALDGGGRKR
jgi:exodeoxyribonuclease V alpha subunit